jgi:hypothetical protein
MLVVKAVLQRHHTTDLKNTCTTATVRCNHFIASQLARDEFVVDVVGRDALLDETVKAAQALRQGNNTLRIATHRNVCICTI